MRRFMLSATLAVAAIALLVSAAAPSMPPRSCRSRRPWNGQGQAIPAWCRTMASLAPATRPTSGDCTGVNEVTMWVDESGVLRGHATPDHRHPGDQVFLEVDQVWNEEKGRWEGTYWITGGAGKFEARQAGANKAKPGHTGRVRRRVRGDHHLLTVPSCEPARWCSPWPRRGRHRREHGMKTPCCAAAISTGYCIKR